MLTELSLSREEFLDYQLQEQREITFCLREFRGLLAFAESSSLPVSIHFDSGGCPVVFGVDDATLAAHFVLATLSDADYSSQSQNHRYDLCVMHVPAEPARGQPTSELVLGRCGCLRACDIFFFFFCPKCVSCILTC
ncbi:hypothetical protein GDO81_023801 [Engystomops pustulosus]|uniref:Uncharacterized protein n=1 Tax=Engystomops pustulosus TaxID=76066 RepID=A0AAV6YKT5_ENGPU|nr:hypothetical protein GDO81_023801 [Engystomops pustulosus]